MNRILVVVSLVASMSAAAQHQQPLLDPVRTWNELALDTIRIKKGSDADAARTCAMVNVAMYDAVNAIRRECGEEARDFALVSPEGAPRHGDRFSAAVAAAHGVLVALFPDQANRFDAQLTADLAALGSSGRVAAGQSWGRQVATKVVIARSGDGSSPVETQPAGSGTGVFRAAWSGTQYRHLTPFAIASATPYVTSGPVAMTSLDYAAALEETRILGNAASADAEKLAIFQYWSLPAGSVQPPGEWVKIALNVTSTSRPLELHEKTRLFTLLTMALSDVVAPTVMTKFTYRHWRPATAIREADADNNASTAADPTWAPRAGGIGSSPEHISGHSSFSAAAATALAGYFCNDDLAFSHVSDSASAGARTYTSFSNAAAEAGRSRVLGGIHFEFSNQAGLKMGRGVATEVLKTKLLRKRGPTHLGSCPL